MLTRDGIYYDYDNRGRPIDIKTFDQKISIRQADAMEKMPQNIESVGENIARSNIEISKSILRGSSSIFSGINRIADEMERQNKLNEYYMLQKEIANFENELIEMHLIKDAYKEMELPKNEVIELTDRQIAFLIHVHNDLGLEKLKELSFSSMKSPFEIFQASILRGKNTKISCIVTTDSGIINGSEWYKISEGDMVPMVNICYTIEELGIVIRKAWLGDDPKNIIIGEKTYRSLNRIYEYSIYREVIERFKYVAEKIHVNAQKCLSENEIARIDSILAKQNIFEYMIPRDSIKLLFDHIYEHLDINFISEQKMLEFKVFINSLNQNIALNNLRRLHQELYNKVRDYRIMKLIS